MRRKYGLFLGLVCLVGLSLVWLPIPPQVDTYPVGQTGWHFQLTRPISIRAGDTADLRLQVLSPPGFDGQVVTTRLDLVGLLGADGELGEMVAPGGEGHFSWNLESDRPGFYEGRLWVYVGASRDLLSAKAIALSVIGPAPAVLWSFRILLLFGILGSTVVIFSSGRQRS